MSDRKGQISEPMVTIPRKEYQQLKADSKKLAALEAAGVDNWEGYEFAMELIEEEDEEI
jgi:hypothetical protein